MTLNFDLWGCDLDSELLDSVNVIQFKSCCADTHRHTHSGPVDLSGPLKRSVTNGIGLLTTPTELISLQLLNQDAMSVKLVPLWLAVGIEQWLRVSTCYLLYVLRHNHATDRQHKCVPALFFWRATRRKAERQIAARDYVALFRR